MRSSVNGSPATRPARSRAGPEPLRGYLDQIGRVPLLDAAGERALARRIERGRAAQRRLDDGEDGAAVKRAARDGARARDDFVRANLRLVVSIARRFPVPHGMELLDLIQEGNLGLERAVDKFDWRKGFKFSTYASFWIRQAIGRAIDRNASLIRVPGHRATELRAALRSSAATGEALDDELEQIRRLTTQASLDQPLAGDGGTLGDLVADDAEGPEAAVADQIEAEAVVALLDVLAPRPRRAVELRMGLADGRGRTYRELGPELGVSAEAARRMVERALAVLREHVEAYGLAA